MYPGLDSLVETDWFDKDATQFFYRVSEGSTGIDREVIDKGLVEDFGIAIMRGQGRKTYQLDLLFSLIREFDAMYNNSRKGLNTELRDVLDVVVSMLTSLSSTLVSDNKDIGYQEATYIVSSISRYEANEPLKLVEDSLIKAIEFVPSEEFLSVVDGTDDIHAIVYFRKTSNPISHLMSIGDLMGDMVVALNPKIVGSVDDLLENEYGMNDWVFNLLKTLTHLLINILNSQSFKTNSAKEWELIDMRSLIFRYNTELDKTESSAVGL